MCRVDRLRVGRGAARAENAQGTPAQSHISPSMLVHQEKHRHDCGSMAPLSANVAHVRQSGLYYGLDCRRKHSYSCSVFARKRQGQHVVSSRSRKTAQVRSHLSKMLEQRIYIRSCKTCLTTCCPGSTTCCVGTMSLRRSAVPSCRRLWGLALRV